MPRQLWPISPNWPRRSLRSPPGPETISTEATIMPRARTSNPAFRLAIWIFWLLASMAVGGMIGAWLWDNAFAHSFGIIAAGFVFTCLRLWR